MKDAEATTTSEPNNREAEQEYAQYEPDTLEIIEEMMDHDDQDDYKTAKNSTENRRNRRHKMTRTTRHGQNSEETRKIDTGAPEKHEHAQGKCKKTSAR